MHTQHVSYQTLGSNRNKTRLWIEGAKLKAAGFIHGASYSARAAEHGFELTLDPQGSRKVSGRVDADNPERTKPILDLDPSAFGAHFGPGTRVRVLFRYGKLAVALHHEERARAERESAFSARLAGGTLREASMFTGGGVSTHAIHTAFRDYGQHAELAWVVDADAGYLDAAAGNALAITDSTEMIVGRAEEIEPAFFRKVDVLSFSMPCSSFSRAGKAKHGLEPEAHEGGGALFGTVSAIRAANPAILVSENVVEAREAPAYVLLKEELKRLGYVVHERVMDSRDTGSVENRKRYWFVAISSGIADGFRFDLIHEAAERPRPRIADLLDADVPEALWFDAAYFERKAETDAAAGKRFSRQILTGEETACGTIGRFYNKRRSTEPFLSRPDGKQRLFTPSEHARMKSAPEGLVSGIMRTRAHEILGQSVDWRQAYLAMACVLAHVTGRASRAAVAPKTHPVAQPA